MKIKSVTITGMHKVSKKTYLFDKDAYFTGPNGSGKSTVLQAVQLGLLGYIPGYPKTNEAIMKHANDRMLAVEVVLDVDGEEKSLSRSWLRTASSIKYERSEYTKLFDESGAINQLSLPVFNFAEFSSMTANKLKEWFVDFLDDEESSSINWKDELKSSLGDRTEIVDEEYISELAEAVGSTGLTGVEAAKFMENQLKTEQSYYKKRIDELQGAVNSLTYYADCEVADEGDVRNKIQEMKGLRDDIARNESLKQQVALIEESMKREEERLSTFEYVRTDELEKEKAELTQKCEDSSNRIKEMQSRLDAANNSYAELAAKRKQLLSINSSVCPYTKLDCGAIASLKNEREAEAAELAGSMAQVESDILNIREEHESEQACYQNILNRIHQIDSAVAAADRDKKAADDCKYKITALDEKLNILKSQQAEETLWTISDIDAQIEEQSNLLIKIIANNRYNEMSEKVNSDKFKAENALEATKLMLKHVGPNGMQTTLMNRPFENLASDIDKYAKVLYSDESVQVKFNLECKANSFSFGLVREGRYIDFECLSSGEKCIFALAMMAVLTERSRDKVKLIVIDDLIDHLDDVNANKLFESLSTIHNIQFILAGVKECSVPEMRVNV